MKTLTEENCHFESGREIFFHTPFDSKRCGQNCRPGSFSKCPLSPCSTLKKYDQSDAGKYFFKGSLELSLAFRTDGRLIGEFV